MKIFPAMLSALRAPRIFGTLFSLLFWSLTQGALNATPNRDVSQSAEIAKPYAIQRYSKLWTAPFFYQTPQVQSPAVAPPTPTPTAICNYVLDGIAEAGGKQFIYLREKSTGTLYELQLKQAVGNLEVTKISLGDQPAYHKVNIRSGNDTFVLQFDLTAPTTVQASPKAPRKLTSGPDLDQEVIAVDPRDALESRRRSLRGGDDWIDEPEIDGSTRKVEGQ